MTGHISSDNFGMRGSVMRFPENAYEEDHQGYFVPTACLAKRDNGQDAGEGTRTTETKKEESQSWQEKQKHTHPPTMETEHPPMALSSLKTHRNLR